MPVPDLVASRHVTSDVTPRPDVVRKKFGVNCRNIYNTLQLVLAIRSVSYAPILSEKKNSIVTEHD